MKTLKFYDPNPRRRKARLIDVGYSLAVARMDAGEDVDDLDAKLKQLETDVNDPNLGVVVSVVGSR